MILEMNVIEIKLSEHATRFLARELKKTRQVLAMKESIFGTMVQDEAAFESLNELECAIPDEIWDEVNKKVSNNG